MNKTALRQKLLDACIEKQRSLVNDFELRLESIARAQSPATQGSYESAELASHAEAVQEMKTLQEAHEFALRELQLLNNLKITQDISRDFASLGAVVVTDKATFFVCVSIEGFTVDGERYLGISTDSPLFNAMQGKRKGETFSCRGKTYQINDVF